METGKWWRFSDYRLKDGVLRPTSMAKMEFYDPWREWDKVSRERGAAKLTTLYAQPLVDLCRELTQCRPGLRVPWKPAEEFKGHSDYKVDWVQPERFSAKQNERLRIWLKKHGLLAVPDQQWPPKGSGLVPEDLNQIEAHFREVGQPVEAFIMGALQLTQAIEALAVQDTRIREARDMGGYNRIQCDELQSLASGARPVLGIRRDGKLTLEWAGNSLLSILAMITISELCVGDGKFLGLCERCGVAVVSGDANAKYCSIGCKYVINKRKQRQSAKQRKDNADILPPTP